MFSVNEVLTQHYPKLAEHPILFKSTHFLLRHLLHEREIQAFGEAYPHLHGLDFIEQVLEYFNVSFSVRSSERENIPTHGKLVIVANHPIGSIDALALIQFVSEIRRDVKVVANQLLMSIKPLNDMLLPVNNMQGGTPKQHLKRIQSHLQSDGAVLIFPAGEVSRLRPEGVRDTHWHSGFLRMAKSAQAPILPVYIDAKNSPVFYGVSMVYKPLATALLVKEMFKQKRKHLPMRIGEIIPHSSYATMNLGLPELSKLFKQHLYRVGSDRKPLFATQAPIALPEDRKTLSMAIHTQCEKLGATQDGKHIYLYKHVGSSAIMREIGRLREVAFRAVGEGTHRRRDIDAYDSYYYHLILWDENDLEIVGAYRFGDAQKLSAPDHPTGLYSASLFDYRERCDVLYNQGLELGRSFVQPRYWGKRSLDYLWFGIGAFLRRYPRFKYLFGPVSISNSLPVPAVQLMVEFYRAQFPALKQLKDPVVEARLPYTSASPEASVFYEKEYKVAFKQFKHQMANMGVNVPTLYKQYTEFCQTGGVGFLGFNIDPEFNDCVDGLVVADMHKIVPKKKARYFDAHKDARD
ncbi:GNAT family N-acyltransferase [Alteromonas oceanisediminis]|uniref:GNAT family N-acyltransferase n=1 Tax=Alteromonas oceanisediminis TaxID=2836180 RepID=UPI001BDB06B8|nr:lysophospholipid acyltransferase family protein [Alteromonas oceanisediminis]MBT0585772.1 GNAT family N-acetyltransferase [Alteromonas oceanisediminis]